AKASWNVRKPACHERGGPVLVSYHMNRLMRLAEPRDYVVTLNATDLVDRDSVIARMVYEHPVYTPESLAAQRRLPSLDTAVTTYAGAYHGWGFHEDGCASGMRAAGVFGAAW
ncbi:MAG: amine oxidase, partial [Saccharothrix sp.]|nr:amine oxidase [Saccharothrix sp.]